MNKMSAQDSPSSNDQLAVLQQERQQQDEEIRDELVEHPRCAIIPSPDKLDRSITSRGLDEIATREDFNIVWQWLTSSELLNTGFYEQVKETVNEDKLLESSSFNALVQLAFGIAFDAIYNTSHPDREEMVLLYYSGHGLRKSPTLDRRHLSFPKLDELEFSSHKAKELKELASTMLKFLNQSQKLNGGELLLHDVGFCDLQGLLAPFVAAVTKPFIDNSGRKVVKSNKHLVVIADSCYSGVLAQDVQKLINQSGPWKENGCSVTVQSACSEDEVTYGGYFTPCFVYLNKNHTRLEELEDEWTRLTEEERQQYEDLALPSPQVKTTRQENPEDESPIMKLSIQGFQLQLFRDPAFFKFCYVSCFTSVKQLLVLEKNNPRNLTAGDAQQFLEQDEFNAIDYKLKQMKNGTPMALVLFDLKDKHYLICAHIHFTDTSSTDISNLSGVNLVHHKRRNNPCLISPEDGGKIPLSQENSKKMFEASKRYVNGKEPGRWEDVARWNMRNNELSVNGNFKSKRSAWMDIYLGKFFS